MRRAALIVVAVLIGMACLAAQDKPASTAPTFTETQTLKLQNATLQEQLARTQMALLQAALERVAAEREAILAAAEKDHPGWVVNRQSMQWEPAKKADAVGPMPPKK